MPNPFFNQFGGNQVPQNNGPFGMFANMMNSFNQFRSNFRGDPRAKVQELLDSGQMSQQQFNQLSSIATQFQNFLNGPGRR